MTTNTESETDSAALFLHSLIHKNLNHAVEYSMMANVDLETLIDILTDIYNDEETES